MRARFKGWCRAGWHAVKQGEIIERYGSKGWAHTGCVNSASQEYSLGVFDRAYADAEARDERRYQAQQEADYQQGIALADHISATRQYFGEEAAAAEEYAWAQKLGDY